MLLLGVAVAAGLAVFAVVFTRPPLDLERVGVRETLAHGEGQRGPWKVTGSLDALAVLHPGNGGGPPRAEPADWLDRARSTSQPPSSSTIRKTP
ncbi:MAG: hypothetical protein M3O70_11995 [Actinomycetota bacterium]|nr:hypothetical protein [Actinomycetota bacterium]